MTRRLRLGAALALALSAAPSAAQYEFPAEIRCDMAARLTVRAAEQPVEPGLAEAALTLTVEGPAALEVEPPRLGDPTAAWREERPAATRTLRDGRAVWTQVIRLRQVKPGAEPVPDVSLRFRAGPGAEWQEAKWVDVLKPIRDLTGPPLPPESPSALRRWGVALAAGMMILLGLVAWAARRRRPAPTVSAEQWALRELERLEETHLPPRADAAAFHTQLSRVVRGYLARRFVPRALEQTTAELLEAARAVPELSARQELLRELLNHCDAAKFARRDAPPEECRRTAALARELLRQTAAATLNAESARP